MTTTKTSIFRIRVDPAIATSQSSMRVGTIAAHFVALALSFLLTGSSSGQTPDDAKLTALIVDGQNNHKVWPRTTRMMKRYLEETGMFEVDVATTRPEGVDESFHPPFFDYDVVVSNYNGAPWPDQTRKEFEQYMRHGGGLVVIHAADNAFPDWPEYNRMIGLGGWGGRNEKNGPWVYYTEDGKVVTKLDPGPGGGHGRQHEFSIVTRDPNHPITRGLPVEWMHTRDELYDKLRGPAEGLSILATAWSDPSTGGTGRHEPILMVIEYEKGRVFHSTLGHADYSQECVGFITTFQRGAEWAATGDVTQQAPDDFPTADQTSSRPFVDDAR